MTNYRKGSKVQWAWGQGAAEGKIVEVFHETVTRKIKGSEITRHGSKENPAFLIEQENGHEALKLQSELQ